MGIWTAEGTIEPSSLSFHCSRPRPPDIFYRVVQPRRAPLCEKQEIPVRDVLLNFRMAQEDTTNPFFNSIVYITKYSLETKDSHRLVDLFLQTLRAKACDVLYTVRAT